MATVAELREHLDAAGVEYPSSARKPELEVLVASVSEPEPPADAVSETFEFDCSQFQGVRVTNYTGPTVTVESVDVASGETLATNIVHQGKSQRGSVTKVETPEGVYVTATWNGPEAGRATVELN